MKFNFEVEVRENLLIVKLLGRIGGETSLEMFHEIKALLDQHNKHNLIMDFAGVDFLDSSGLGSLVAVNSSLLRNGRELTLTSVSDNIMDLLKITNLLRILKTAESLDDVV